VSLSTICDTIATAIGTELPAVKAARGPVGLSLDDSELVAIAGRQSICLPAVLVLVLQTQDAQNRGGKVVAKVNFAAVCLASGGVQSQKDAAVVDLAANVMRVVVLAKSSWGDDEVTGPPLAVDSENLYKTAVDKAGAAIWAVTWWQECELRPLTAVELDSLKLVHVETTHTDSSEAEDPNAIDEIVLEGG